MKQWKIIFSIMLFCASIALGSSFASHTKTSTEWYDGLLIVKAKTIISQQVEERGEQRIREFYTRFSNLLYRVKEKETRDALVTITAWMEKTYDLTPDMANSTASSRRNKDEVFLNKDGTPYEPTKKKFIIASTASVSTSYNKTEEKEVQPEVNIVVQEEEMIPEEESNEEEPEIELVYYEPGDEDEWYIMENGRINLATLRRERLERVNELRDSVGRTDMTFESSLHKTATERATTMRNWGNATHRRTSSSAYYDYRELENWFADRGVSFTNVDRATFTENIGYAWFDCNADDCTDVALDSMRRIYEFFENERGTTYTVHYDTMVHPYFEQVGVGIAIDEDGDTLYMAAHYGTEVIRN